MSVEKVKEEVRSRTEIPPNEQILIFGGKQLEEGKRLSHYRISNGATLYLVMRLLGGAEQVNRPQIPTRRKIDPSIPRSDEPCMILYTEDDSVRMPCGHVISPDGLMDYCWNEVCVGVKTKVVCCLCNADWDVDTIRRYGGATDEETALIQECLSRNYCRSDPKISECPGCTSFCVRINESKRCTSCRYCANRKGRAFYFCWDCKKEWIGEPRNEYCGNDKCTNEEILEKLRTCPEKDIKYLRGLKAPSLRACPNCGSLIQHADACKHVTCKECKVKFCFVCLRICYEGSSFCGSYNVQCSVAERQTKIPCRR